MPRPDGIHLLPIRDPVEWTRQDRYFDAVIECVDIVDGAVFDPEREPEEVFRVRLDVTTAERWRHWSAFGWSLIVVWNEDPAA